MVAHNPSVVHVFVPVKGTGNSSRICSVTNRDITRFWNFERKVAITVCGKSVMELILRCGVTIALLESSKALMMVIRSKSDGAR